MIDHDLWTLAKVNEDTLRLSTLMTAKSFHQTLADQQGIAEAIAWCQSIGITRVFLETYRDTVEAPRDRVVRARDAFRAAGIAADGGVTTVRLGKPSTGWNLICCYNDPATLDNLQKQFEIAAGLFDLIMIDDFWFTDCQCADCTAAKGTQSWADYRRGLMNRLSRERILEPARRVNPQVKIIIKYPQWYDRYHLRGYDVIQETKDFDYIWAGTELRDPDHTDPELPHVQQYEAFYVMRYLGLIGQEKCLGGWFDTYETSPANYVEQAWQTVLGGAREMLLFAYGLHRRTRGAECAAALCRVLPQLYELASLVRTRPLSRGVVMPRPAHAEPGDGRYFYDFAGMLGLPVVPALALTAGTPSALLSAENLHDPGLVKTLQALLTAGGHVVATDGLLRGLGERGEDIIAMEAAGLRRLEVKGEPAALLHMPDKELEALRDHLLRPLGISFAAPTRVALTVLGEDLVAVANYRDEPAHVQVRVDGRRARLRLRISYQTEPVQESESHLELPPRTLAVLQL